MFLFVLFVEKTREPGNFNFSISLHHRIGDAVCLVRCISGINMVVAQDGSAVHGAGEDDVSNSKFRSDPSSSQLDIIRTTSRFGGTNDKENVRANGKSPSPALVRLFPFYFRMGN